MGRAIPLTPCASNGILWCDLHLYLVLSNGNMEEVCAVLTNLETCNKVITKEILSCKHNLITCIEPIYVLRNSVTQEDIITSILPNLHDRMN